MADVFSARFRSEIMSRIRSKGNRATEQRLRTLMRSRGIVGWRRNQTVFGSPDFVFRASRLAVFVDGCFWHGCPIHCSTPVSNRAFWRRKLSANRTRDLHVNRALRKKGWRVLRIWQHDLAKRPDWCVSRIMRALAEQSRLRLIEAHPRQPRNETTHSLAKSSCRASTNSAS
ncbi:MAG TPA: very short patch repair endonuclease [Candidatus Paceibacterota bacterium]|nr:very short patch repair endonuclease [Candidatus Paceibacterota bacterium]